MSNLCAPLCLVAALIAIAPLACADEFTRPGVPGNGASCIGIPWCDSIQPAYQKAVDPISDEEAIVYYLSPTYFPANASNEFVSGDVQFVTVSTSADVDLLRFETLNIGTVSLPDYVAAVFLFKGGIGGNEPASLQSANVTQTIAMRSIPQTATASHPPVQLAESLKVKAAPSRESDSSGGRFRAARGSQPSSI